MIVIADSFFVNAYWLRVITDTTMPPHKKNKPVRKRDWKPEDWDTASRQNRSRREENAPQDTRAAADYFSGVTANALVVSPYGVLAFVQWNDDEVLCRVDDVLVDGKSSVLAPGDQVLVERDKDDAVIVAVRPRRNKLSRPDIGRDREQVFAANIDYAVVVASVAKPMFNTGLIDRYLVAAQAGGVTPVICLNKIDLAETEPESVQQYRELGVQVIATSCETVAGIDQLRALLSGKLSVLTGNSGVGKSSLVNALDPDFDIDTQEVSESTKKGRHTTTTSRMYALSGDIRIIDTPGIRQLGLWGVTPAELNYFFPDLAQYSPMCKFRDCTHTHEPKCAVRDAVEQGQIGRARYASYVRIRTSLTEDSQS